MRDPLSRYMEWVDELSGPNLTLLLLLIIVTGALPVLATVMVIIYAVEVWQ